MVQMAPSSGSGHGGVESLKVVVLSPSIAVTLGTQNMVAKKMTKIAEKVTKKICLPPLYRPRRSAIAASPLAKLALCSFIFSTARGAEVAR